MGYLICILVYISGIILYGIIIGKKKVKTSDDFVVAGRQLPFFILIGTLLASWCGGGGITGSASVVYMYGPWVGALHFAGAPIGMLLLYFISSKVRSSTKITVPEVFGARYGDVASIIAVVCIMLAYVGLCATQIKAAGNIISLITGMDANLATVLSAVGILFLTVSGGMISVAYTDAVSALMMVGGFLIALPLLFGKAGGWAAAIASMPAEKTTLTGGLSVVAILGYMIPTITLLLGDQNMMQRFASAKSAEEAKKSNLGLFVAEITVCVLIILMCTAGISLYQGDNTLAIPSNVIFTLAVDCLPFVLGAVVLVACVAFIVTTADSYLLSAATNVTYDVWGRYIKKDADDRQKIYFMRVTIVVLTVLAVVLTLFFPTILSLQMTAYTMYGAAITPALLFALFWKKVTPAGGIAGIVTGGVVTVVWTMVLNSPYGIASAIVAVPAAVVMIVLVSALTGLNGEASYARLYENSKK